MSFRGLTAAAPLKLIAVILFAILGPSVLVTALGLVAVFQAQAFVRNRFSEPLRTKVESVRERLQAEWGGRVALYAESLRDAPGRRQHLRSSIGQDPWIRDVFLVTPAGIELIPEPPPRLVAATGMEPELRELWRLEQDAKDYLQGRAECWRLLAEGGDEAVVLETHLTAARLHYALGSPQTSKRHLWEVYHRFGNTVDASGVLRGPPLLLRIAALERDEENHEREAACYAELRQFLARHGGYLDAETARYYEEKIAGSGYKPAPATPTLRLLRPSHLAQLDAALGPQARTLAQGRAQRLVRHPDLGELDVLLLATDTTGVIVGLILNREALHAEALTECRALDLPPQGLSFVSPHDAAAAAASLAASPCPEPLGRLVLRYVAPPGALPEGFRGFDVIGLATFTWAVIVLVITIVVGALFTIRAVLRETRTAKLKTDFVSFITHELKTPLTSIRMLTETILDGRTESPDDTRDCLAMISNETERLSKLIEQVLELSKVEHRQKQFRFATCDMEEVVRDAVRLFQDLNRLKPREVEVNSVQSISRIKMDRASMIELLLNLLTNAAKYSPGDRKITIILRETIDDICVDVVDRGIGIKKRDQKKIFQGFFRANDYLARDVEGTGLGLTFARYIARVHNGDIKVSSQPNSGSTFTLQLRKTEVMAG